jgi:hypothetical protein
MIFINPTGYPALMFSTALDDERILASVVLRVTYTLTDGRLTVAKDQIWKVSPEPWESPAGKMEEDGPFMRGGVDLFVFGRAWAPDDDTRSMKVCLKAGSFVREAIVTGRRTWVWNRKKELVPSDPEPFASMPLTLAEAFGGTSEADGLPIPFPDNSMGKGYHVTEEQALGQELPNLEEPEHRMKLWSDIPPVCGFGFCPRASSARLRNGTILGEAHNIVDFRPQLFNQAFVPMVAPTLIPGDPVELVGFSPYGPLRFAVPKPPVGVRLRFGERIVERAPYVDQIGVEVEAARMFATWRFPFRYVVREREKRMCQLVEGSFDE